MSRLCANQEHFMCNENHFMCKPTSSAHFRFNRPPLYGSTYGAVVNPSPAGYQDLPTWPLRTSTRFQQPARDSPVVVAARFNPDLQPDDDLADELRVEAVEVITFVMKLPVTYLAVGRA